MSRRDYAMPFRAPAIPEDHVPERALTVRAAPSVASRGSHSRRHRRNRSEYGGTSYQAQNEFPIFSQTGDVEIIISADGRTERYLLHRLYLAQCSGFFECGTSENWSRGQQLSSLSESSEDTAQKGPPVGAPRVGGNKTIWRYELDPGSQENDIPMLVQKDPNASIFGGNNRSSSTRTKPTNPSGGFLRSVVGNFSAMNLSHGTGYDDPAEDILRDYDNMFRIFYNYPPTLDAVNIANAYVQCKSLLTLADMYDALEVVGPRVDHHMLQFQNLLWKQIAKYPPSYLKLGYLARSKVIFSEAIVHVVGQWPAGATHLRTQLPDSVMEIIEDKVEELEEMKTKIEGRLFRITLLTAKGERVSPHNAYVDWLAVSLFREWLADNTTPPPPPTPRESPRTGERRALPPNPPLNTGKIYRLLGRGGSAYLGHDECKRFLKLRPEEYNGHQLKRFERRLDELKAVAKEIARPLMTNCLALDLGRDGGSLGYLTCTRVEERDFPWET